MSALIVPHHLFSKYVHVLADVMLSACSFSQTRHGTGSCIAQQHEQCEGGKLE